MIIIAVTTFLFCSAAVYLASNMALHAGRLRSQRRISDRIENVLASGTTEKHTPVSPDGLSHGHPITRIDNALSFFRFHDYIARELRKANLNLKVSEFIAIIMLAATIPALLVRITLHSEPLIIILFCAGALLPLFAIKRLQSTRRRAFTGQLLDAVTLVSNSLKSGNSFLQSIDIVTLELPPPISEEFRKVLLEIECGIPFDEAVEHLVFRMESGDLDLIMTCVMIQRQVGGNLAEILDKIGLTIRERIRIKGQIKTLTAQGRLSGLILALLPVGLFVFMLVFNPGYISVFFTKTLGRILLGTAAANQIIGMVLIRKIVDIKV